MMKRRERTLNLLNILFPEKCPICGALLTGSRDTVCRDCKRHLPVVKEPYCMRCGKPIDSSEREFCQDCRDKSIRRKEDDLKCGTAVWVYTERMKKAMADFKYRGCYEEAIFFAEELVRIRGDMVRKWNPDYIVPVPLHRRRLWFRGYNQAECLAKELGLRMRIPMLPALERVRATGPQKNFDDKGRRNNVKNAFCVADGYANSLQGRTVLLVDDIYTTGATLEACAGALAGIGTDKVYFACLCIGRDY